MSIAILSDELDLEVPCLSHRHDARFLEVIGVTDLRHFFYNKIQSDRMDELARIINSNVAPGREFRDVIWVFVFAHGAACSDQAISRDSTHAVSVFSRSAYGMEHRYFEREGDDFREVPELAVIVSAMLDLDEIRLLHFGAFAAGGLPAQSAIYEFRAKSWGVEDALQRTDYTLRAALLLDAGKVGGAPAIGLYGDPVYTALLQRPQGPGEDVHCGNSTSCNNAGNGICVAVPPSSNGGYYCQAAITGDGWVSVFTRAVQVGLVSLDEVDFPAARAVITDLLPKSARGRELMAHYYIASLAIRRDRAALEEYVRILPTLRASLRNLLDGSNDVAVITQDLRDAWTCFVRLHQDARLPALPGIASAVRSLGWDRLATKADFLRALADNESDTASNGEHSL